MFSGEFKKISGEILSQNCEVMPGCTVVELVLQMDNTGTAEAEIPFLSGVGMSLWAKRGTGGFAPAQAMQLDVKGYLGRIAAMVQNVVVAKAISQAADTAPVTTGTSLHCAGKCNVKVTTPANGAQNNGKSVTIGLLFMDPIYNWGV